MKTKHEMKYQSWEGTYFKLQIAGSDSWMDGIKKYDSSQMQKPDTKHVSEIIIDIWRVIGLIDDGGDK